MSDWREWRRNTWVYPCLWLIVLFDWLFITLPAKRWAKQRPESQT